MPTDSDQRLFSETKAERERLAAIFGGLSPEQWAAPSLCAGWSTGDVVAHITSFFRLKPLGYLAGVALAGFSINRWADRDARSTARAMSQAELVDLLRRNIDNPWQPPGGGAAAPLSHDVIHGLDVTEALGLAAPPTERIALVLASVNARQAKFFGVELKGRLLTATDADVTVGDGSVAVPMTAKEILLAITGRRPLEESVSAANQ
jgi:uncharacterized protein (TIGR03083 family)